MKRSLVVEDDELTGNLLSLILEENGYSVDYFQDGQQAIDAVFKAISDKNHYNLIMCDIMLPGADGHSIIKKIREFEDEVDMPQEDKSKILIVSSSDNPKDYALGLFKGQISSYIIKPFSRAQIVQELSKLQ